MKEKLNGNRTATQIRSPSTFQFEVVLLYPEKSVALHLSELFGKSGPLNIQVICKLLAIEWYIEFSGTGLKRYAVQI